VTDRGATGISPGTEALAREVAAYLADKARDMATITRVDLRYRLFAAAALMRCRAILESLSLLCANNHARTAGALSRGMWETWLVGTFVLLGGTPALRDIMASTAHHSLLLREKLDLGPDFAEDAERWLERNRGTTTRYSYEALARRVQELLRERGEDVDVTDQYNRLYRGESGASAHAGLGSIAPYVDTRSEPWGLSLAPESLVPGERAVLLGLSILLDLAKRVFGEFGLSADELSGFQVRGERLFEASRPGV
jgi:hypothetical protein